MIKSEQICRMVGVGVADDYGIELGRAHKIKESAKGTGAGIKPDAGIGVRHQVAGRRSSGGGIGAVGAEDC